MIDVDTELQELSPLLHNMKNKQGQIDVPDGYFHLLPQLVLDTAHGDEIKNDQSLPTDYFTNLPEAVLSKTTTLSKKPNWIVSMRPWLGAVAACAICILVVLPFTMDPNKPSGTLTPAPNLNISSADEVEYLLDNFTSEEDIFYLNGAYHLGDLPLSTEALDPSGYQLSEEDLFLIEEI